MAKYSHTPLIQRFNGVLWCLSSQQQFGALTVKFSLKPYNQKDRQFKKYCHTPFNYRLQLFLWCVLCRRHFGAHPVKLSLDFQNTVSFRNSLTSQIHHYLVCLIILIITAPFESFWYEILSKRHYDLPPAKRPICKMLSNALKSSFLLILRCLLLHRHLKAVAVKFSLNHITTLTMPIFKDTVKRL